MKCPNCGKRVNSEAKFCLHCGYPLHSKGNRHIKMPRKRFHLNKKLVWTIVGIVVVVLLIIGGLAGKEYFSPARTLSRQLPKSTWIESHQAEVHNKKAKRHKNKSKKIHYHLIVSNGSEMLSFGQNRKTARIFKILSSNSAKAKQLRSNLSRNMKNTIIQDNFSYKVKNDSLHFKDGMVFKDVQKSQHGFTFKCYKGKKFLHTGHLKVYKSLPSSIE